MFGSMGEEEVDLYGAYALFCSFPVSQRAIHLSNKLLCLLTNSAIIGLLSIDQGASQEQIKKAYRKVRFTD